MMIPKTRGWYWKVHGDEYERFEVGSLPQFCGWDLLIRMIHECENTDYFRRSHLFNLSEAEREELRRRLVMRDRALIATAFETGGRISEVLQLRKSNIEVLDDRLLVTNMPIVKRYDKVGETVIKWEGEGEPQDPKWHWSPRYDAWIKRRFITRPRLDRRNPLEIPRFEPLTGPMVEWLKVLPGEEDAWLFPGYGRQSDRPITPTRAYQIVVAVGRRCGARICNHWFRSMRASQLAEEYGWREYELIRFFGWQSDKYARLYAKLSKTALFESMRPERLKIQAPIQI